MPTMVGTQNDLNELLEKLIELDLDAVQAYQAAIDRLEEPGIKTQLEQFMGDHVRHTQDLGKILEDSGRKAPEKGSTKSVLTKGKVVMAGLVGDEAILKAMKTNEDDTNQAYEQAVNNDVAPATVREVLRRNLADERRHRQWIEQKLSSM